MFAGVHRCLWKLTGLAVNSMGDKLVLISFLSGFIDYLEVIIPREEL